MESFINNSMFLAMLSSEKSIVYWVDLDMPVHRNLYKETNKFARGCLELFMFSYIESSSPKIEIQKSWESYSLENRVLEKETLLNYQIKETPELKLERIFYTVGEILAFENIEEIHKWSKLFFRYEPDPIIEYASGLKFLLDNSKDDRHNIKKKISLSANNLKKVHRFCNRVLWRNNTLEDHFSVANNVYKMTLPDEWEMLLQDFFFEGARAAYGWMDSVEYSLRYVNFYNAWSDLKSEIGEENMGVLLNTLTENDGMLSVRFFNLREANLEKLEAL